MTTGKPSEKVVLITGATDGIGEQGAKEIASKGYKVVIVGRDEEKCEKSRQAVIEFSGHDRVDYLLADLSSMEQVASLAEEFRSRNGRLDVLVNNAGAGFVDRKLTVDGFERTFALNHLAYFLLTNLLLEMLTATPASRVVSTSSGSHYRGEIDFNDPHLKRGYGVLKAYAQSKLANVMFTYALARRIEGMNITANCFHPGRVMTGIWRKVPVIGRLVEWSISPTSISVEEGTETLTYLATSEEVERISGKYFYKKQVRETNPVSNNIEAQEKLWELSAEMVAPWLA